MPYNLVRRGQMLEQFLALLPYPASYVSVHSLVFFFLKSCVFTLKTCKRRSGYFRKRSIIPDLHRMSLSNSKSIDIKNMPVSIEEGKNGVSGSFLEVAQSQPNPHQYIGWFAEYNQVYQ